ncbi:MAG: DUF4199 domain-containing protein [Chitinophagales bacterium]|nr:DUF4199 domain-containing protein [Chitinophagales bacterium]MDW8394160.1 DUF4199 domain-containing protein [Chitinophagales bacterium]
MSRELRYGLWGGLALWIWMTLGYVVGWHRGPANLYAALASALLLSLFIYLAIRHKRDHDQGGCIRFREAFLAGMMVSFVSGLMVGVYLMVYSSYINPGEVEAVVAETRRWYEARQLPAERVEEAVKGVRASYTKFGRLTYGIGNAMLLGAVVSLICAALMRRTEAESDPNAPS